MKLKFSMRQPAMRKIYGIPLVYPVKDTYPGWSIGCRSRALDNLVGFRPFCETRIQENNP